MSKKTIVQFLQISLHTDMKSTKKQFSRQKPQIQSVCDQISFRIQFQTFPPMCNTREIQSKTQNTAEEKSFQ